VAVAENVAAQIAAGNRSIVGLMIESNLEAGNQIISADRAQLRYGVSVTDPCLDWTTTEALLRSLDRTLRSAPRVSTTEGDGQREG
jgi:3-deoxy-7-phosphoheptulonate synthase